MATAPKAKKLVAVRLPDEYVKGIETIASANYESASDVIRRAVRHLLAKETKKT